MADTPPFDPVMLRKMLTALYLELPSSVAETIQANFGPLVSLVENSVFQPWRCLYARRARF